MTVIRGSGRHPETFKLTDDHLKLIRHFYVGWQFCETGAPEIDPKRPYGNSYVPRDMAEILDVELDEDKMTNEEYEAVCERLLSIHYETATVLQIVLSTGSFDAGTYRRPVWYDSKRWERVTENGETTAKSGGVDR